MIDKKIDSITDRYMIARTRFLITAYLQIWTAQICLFTHARGLHYFGQIYQR